jgi:predicted Zn-dependent peptidase
MTRAVRGRPRRVLRSGLVLLLLAAAALATPRVAAVADTVERTTLDNGLTLIVRENPVAPVVAVSLLIGMGARWETADNAGISNFLQAVLVKGTNKRDGAALADAVAALGGKMNAYGETDYSEIRSSALARFWRPLLELTAEVALDPKLAPADVDNERDWLLSRVQRRRDNPSARAFDELYVLLYGPHPYGRPPLGTQASLARLDRDALVAWYRAAYQPKAMILAVSGQVSVAEVREEARRLFGGMPRGDGLRAPSNPAPVPAARRVIISQPAQQVQIVVGGIAPGLDDPDHAAVKVLSTVLGGGMAGRLFVELRDKRGLAYAASSFYEPVREPGALVLYLGTAPGNAGSAEQGLTRELERIRNEPIDAAELARAKNFLLGKYDMDRRTNERRAWYEAFYTLEHVTDYPARYRRAVEGVTAADVQRVARRYLSVLSTIVLQPPAAAPSR